MTRFQLFTFIVQTQIGIGVLTFPYDLEKSAGVDGWISVLLGGALIQLLIVAFVKLGGRFPGRNLFEIAPIVTGKWIGNLLNVVFILHFAMTSCLILLLEVVFVNLWIIPSSNPWLVVVTNLIILLFFVKQSIRIIARYHAIISFLIIFLLFFLFLGIHHLEYRYLLPIAQKDWQTIVLGMKSTVLSFLGFELLLVIMPDVQTSGKSLLPPLLWANGATTFFYLVVVLVCFQYFSPETMPLIPQPVPFYLNGISLPFMDRLDLIFLSIWLVKVTATLIGYAYSAAKGLGILFHKGIHRVPVFYLSPFVAAIGFFWKSETLVKSITDFVKFESFIILAIPLLLLLIAWVTGRKEIHQV